MAINIKGECIDTLFIQDEAHFKATQKLIAYGFPICEPNGKQIGVVTGTSKIRGTTYGLMIFGRLHENPINDAVTWHLNKINNKDCLMLLDSGLDSNLERYRLKVN